MTTTPRGAAELVASQAIPETTVNEQIRHTEAGACHFIVADDDLTAPPGACSDGASYIIAATATGLWAGKEKQIATALGTNAASGWTYHVPAEGFTAYIQDENARKLYDGSDWVTDTTGGSFTTASTTEVLTGTDAAKGVTPDALAALWEQGADVASAGTISLGEGGYFNVTGTTTITDIDFATDKAGRKAWVKFAGALILTNGANLILPTGANITTAAGDTACFVSEGSDVVRCVAYQRASGAALSGGSSVANFTDLADVPASYTGYAGKVAAVKGTEDGIEFVAATSVTAAADGTLDQQFFGDGSDGDVSLSSGTTTLTRDMYYNNLTISGTATIRTDGYRIFVKGTLDISAAPANAIFTRADAANNGSFGSGGAIAVGATANVIGAVAAAATAGANGGTGAGSQSSAVGSYNGRAGAASGAGGAGGAVGGTVGGTSRAATSPTTNADIRRLTVEPYVWLSSWIRLNGGAGGPGGSSGAGDGTGTGGGGGGGGAGGGVIVVAARTINRSGSTAAGAIAAKGGNGGNGGLGTGGTNRGGGGGGAGGGGGWIILVYRSLTGSTATNCIDATGGNGGAGGNGTGTGGGGNSGEAGGGGRIDVYNLGAGTQTITAATAAAAGNAASGGTGGAAKTATTQAVSL